MRLLIFTQIVDKNDPVLGFFHEWIIKISEKCESVYVICLKKGEYDLPKNVTVYSLGKEEIDNRSTKYEVRKIQYIINLYKYLSRVSGSYDKVFVHMNQEYVLLAGLYWKLKNIPVYMWRNHSGGSILTRIAVGLSKKVFCTSTHSYTARFKKTIIMPAGINTGLFKSVDGFVRKKYSVCMIGRLSPVKHNEIALETFNILISRGAQATLSFIGPVAEKDLDYFEKLKKYVVDNNLSNVVSFSEGVNPDKLPQIYSSFEICLNFTKSGAFDKTIVEAASCGVIPLVSSQSFAGLLPAVCITDNIPQNIAKSITRLLDPTEQIKIQKDLEKFVDSQSLSSLITKFFVEVK